MKRTRSTVLRAGAAALLLALVCAMAVPVQAAELMLREEPTPPRTFGWTLVGLSALSFGVAYNAYTQSQDKLDEADSYYDDYQAAENTDGANHFHRKTRNALDAAVGFESTANGGLALGVLFGLAAWYAFSEDYSPDPPLILTSEYVGLRVHLRF